MKRALVFSLAYYPHVGGAEIALKEITDRIKDIEWHMVTLRFRGEPKLERIGNIVVHRVGVGSSYLSKILFVPFAAVKALSLHRKERFDAFWAMMSYMLFPIVLLRGAGVRVPYLLTLQEGDPWEHMFTRWFIVPLRPLLASGFANAGAVQVISTYLGTWAVKMGYKKSIEVIPNGYSSTWFSVVADTPQNRKIFWKNQHQIDFDASSIILITTSRLVRKNAIDDVIRALTKLQKNVHFVILGIGKEEETLRKLAKEISVEDRTHFLGEVSNTKVAYRLSASDIFIRPSRSEGMGNSFIEAMAAGLPVIATQEGGIADFLFDGRKNPDRPTTGWAVDKDSPEQIAAAVEEILANPKQVRKVTETAKAMVIEKYDWDLIAAAMKGLFDRLLVGARIG